MAALITLVAICLFAAGVGTGIIGVAVLAIRREERNLTLTCEVPDTVTRVRTPGERAVLVRAPRRTADDREALV